MDLFDQLADAPPPPPPPASFDARMHARLNQVLAAWHVVEFFVRAVPYGMYWLFRGLIGWLHVAISGRQLVEPRPKEIIPETPRDAPP